MKNSKYHHRDQNWLNSFLWGVLHSVVSACIVYQVNKVQPNAYMDEYFHEKQTLDYVAGYWSNWDPAITTPPGLYILTSTISRLLFPFVPYPSVCEFRYLNSALLGINYFLVSILLNEKSTDVHLLTSAVVTLPVLFFTSILFYTDQLSLTLVLLTIWLHRRGYRFLSFLSASSACFVRQTNIVWSCFIVGQAVVNRLSSSKPFERKQPLHWIFHLLASPHSLVEAVLKACINDCPLIMMVGVGFLAFVFLNDGIVLGDRSAHEVSLNIPQLFYFFAFTVFHTPLRFVRFIFRFGASIKRNGWRGFVVIVFVFALLLTIGFASVHCCTLEHKYNLSDNRHYTFYLWARFFKRFAWFRYVAVPFYVIAGAYMLSAFIPLDGCPCRLEELLQALVFFICTAVCLIPTSLLEFRYFIIPFVLWRMQLFLSPVNNISFVNVVSEWTLNFVVNIVTVWVFLYRPFRWISQPLTYQRFMW